MSNPRSLALVYLSSLGLGTQVVSSQPRQPFVPTVHLHGLKGAQSGCGWRPLVLCFEATQ